MIRLHLFENVYESGKNLHVDPNSGAVLVKFLLYQSLAWSMNQPYLEAISKMTSTSALIPKVTSTSELIPKVT